MPDSPQDSIGSPPSKNYQKRGKIGSISLTGLPSQEELAQQTPEQRERFPLYTPEQIEQETRTVRLDISFGDVVKIRDQAVMIIACMQELISASRRHSIGPVRQRIEARREAASLGSALSLLNGKRPFNFSKKRPPKYHSE